MNKQQAARILSTLLAVMFALTAFGVTTIFGGVLGASAEFYDYYVYTQFPGLDAFNAADYALAWSKYVEYSGLSSAYLPDGNPVDSVTTFTVKAGTNGIASVATLRQRNADPENNTQNADFRDSPNWTANDKLNGKDIFGDTGYDFGDADGFCMWVGLNEGCYYGKLKISLFSVPSQDPYYSKSEDGSTDMSEYGKGFVYSSELVSPDEDGYYYFNFRTDFSQTDWWSVDDNGIKQYQQGRTPVPDSKLSQINAFEIRFNNGLQEGDVIYVGDFRAFRDTRVYVDELAELCEVFDAIAYEEYTEESYAAALEVYLAAYDILQNQTAYSQKRINAMAVELRAAIRDLKPMFMAEKKDVSLAGFEVWDDEDLEAMGEGGLCLDTAMVDDSIYPSTKDQSVIIFAQAVDGPPTYGWSLFTNATEDGEPVKNPFELQEGSEPLSAASGIRFWMKWDDSLEPAPQACRIGLGVSAEEIYFECEETAVDLPEKQGYVGVSWVNFYDVDGDEDIYDWIDEIDTIYIYLEGVTGIYYIADLTAFEWSISAADIEALEKAIDDARAYMGTLNEADWYYKTWDCVFEKIKDAEDLLDKYGVTEEECDDAIAAITYALNKLVLADEAMTRETALMLEGLCKSARTYWRGNLVQRTYMALAEELEIAERMIEEGDSEEHGLEEITKMQAAIAGLVPIQPGSTVTSIHSFESYSGRDFNRATGDRNDPELVDYKLDSEFDKLPDGYSKALKMTAKQDMTSDTGDEHGMLQFKAMYRDGGNHVIPILIEGTGSTAVNTLIGDLSGTDGICLWVGVNDMNLVQKCTMRVAVSNCTVGPFFERSVINIPIPATGSGWIYLPWEYFEHFDDWTHGQEIDLAKIYFYGICFDGAISAGLEVYVTGIHAYKDVANGTWETPVISNVTDGATYDVSEQDFIPYWDVGAAMLDGEFLIYGNPVVKNGAHTLVVTNGDKSTTVNFSTTGAIELSANVEENGEYNAGYELRWEPADADVYLNGEPIEVGYKLNEPGEYTLIVTKGDKELTVNFTVKCDHDWVETSRVAPTCTKKGSVTYTCALCGDIIIDEIAALGHTWSEWEIVAPATCSSEGEMVRVCNACYVLDTEVVPLLPHTWSEWEVTVPNTYYSEGEEVRVCLSCGVMETRVIPAAELTGIAFAELPSKLGYIELEGELDMTGAVLTLYYDTAGSRTASIEKRGARYYLRFEDGSLYSCAVSGFDGSAVGVQTVTLTYRGVSASFEIEVFAKSVERIEITQLPIKTEYELGEALNISGGRVTVFYNNGTYETARMITVGGVHRFGFDSTSMTAPVEVSGFDSGRNGRQTVTVSYGGVEDSFTVAVGLDLMIGDADFDGEITVADALAALRIAVGFVAATPELATVCDVDFDGEVDVGDALAILRCSVGLAAQA